MKTTATPRITTPTAASRSWAGAYKSFLLNRQESIFLKIAPIAIILGSPEIIASNILPVIGEVVDVGGITLTAMVVVRTYNAVKKYR